MTPLALGALLVLTVTLQAVLPARRLTIVLAGAAVSCLVATRAAGASTARILAAVPWDVLVMLVGLGAVTEVLVASEVFSIAAVRVTRWTRATPRVVALAFAVCMYAVSGLVNNLTALLLVLPVLLVVFRVLGVTQRYLRWTLGVLLTACNLGGAATPIGDFPAILLLGRGAMSFSAYLLRAAPLTAIALIGLLAVVDALVRPARDVGGSPLTAALTIDTLAALHRGLRVRRRYLLPGALALAAMLIAWVAVPASSGLSPELICWLGASAPLLGAGSVGESIARSKVDIEATLFLLGLFVMVGAAREGGLFHGAARGLAALPLTAHARVAVFLVGAALITGVFSAGPGMAALLDVAAELARVHPPATIYTGLALSVCAGSSLFLTAATAGPLTQALVERAALRAPDGTPLRFGFLDFAPVGLLSFVIILAVALASTLSAL